MSCILFIVENHQETWLMSEMLKPWLHQWEAVFVASDLEALTWMNARPTDVLIIDAAVLNIELLERVRLMYPCTVRMVMTDPNHRLSNLQAAGVVHQFIMRPCDALCLAATINRALTFNSLLQNQALRNLTGQLRNLPSPPTLYLRITAQLASGKASPAEVADTISQDMSMSTKVLQLVNSAMFSLSREVSDIRQAAVLLGLETLRDLVLSVHIFSQFNPASFNRLGLSNLWDHSMRVGAFAKIILATTTSDRNVTGHAFIAGFLHDVGKLVMAENLPTRYASIVGLARRNNYNLLDAEKELFQATHAEVGGYLLGLWGLPDAVVLALADHHEPWRRSPHTLDLSAAVYVANYFDYILSPRHNQPLALPEIHSGYLNGLGVLEEIPSWFALCKEKMSGLG